MTSWVAFAIPFLDVAVSSALTPSPATAPSVRFQPRIGLPRRRRRQVHPFLSVSPPTQHCPHLRHVHFLLELYVATFTLLLALTQAVYPFLSQVIGFANGAPLPI